MGSGWFLPVEIVSPAGAEEQEPFETNAGVSNFRNLTSRVALPSGRFPSMQL